MIIPRWEWRTFGDRFGRADAAFGAMEPTGIQESDELYLLGQPDRNVKVRDALMDIKVLRETDASGLERWEPVMKATFPLDEATTAQVADALGIPVPTGSAPWSLERFLDAVAVPGGIRPVRAHKRRVRYRVNGCTSEVSEVRVGDRTVRTIAIESEDAAAVREAVRSVGLAGYRNVDYLEGLAALVDGSPRVFAVIDVGTNSVKLHIGALGTDGTWTTVADRAEVTRLGEGAAESGRIADAAIDRTATAIEGMAAEARAAGAVAVAAVGTAVLRTAANADAVLAAIHDRAGVRVEVISGDEESRLAYLAVSVALPARGSTLVFDTGGGSSQFTFGDGAAVVERFSVDVGAVRFTERFGLDGMRTPEQVAAARAAIAADLSRIQGRPRPDLLVGMGGAITNLTAVSLGMRTYDPARIQGATLTAQEVDRQIDRYRSMDADARRGIAGLQPKRAEVILAGACIVRTVMDLVGHQQLIVSDRGLRHGVLAERFGPDPGGTST
jgi:exopolyphosphatase/guanosine-5'-triphosphate,3'-diphosphate pyrophosphatase